MFLIFAPVARVECNPEADRKQCTDPEWMEITHSKQRRAQFCGISSPVNHPASKRNNSNPLLLVFFSCTLLAGEAAEFAFDEGIDLAVHDALNVRGGHACAE